MAVEIPAISKVTTVDQLTTQINDRLRRVSENLGTGATGATGPAGPAGAPGSASLPSLQIGGGI
jgi:hypothetical protein